MSVQPQLVTVSLNPAMDRLIEAHDFTIGGHSKVRQLHRYPAGKAINVSRALAVLGRPSIATGFIGSDEFQNFESFLRETSGPRIVSQFLSVRGKTRENITIHDPDTKVETHLRDEGFEISDHEFRRMASKLQLLARPDVVMCFCGSLPPGITAEMYRDLIAQCASNGARVVVDTSGPALKAVIDLPLWIIKPNLPELSELVGRTVTTAEEIRTVASPLNKHIQIVLVTAAAEGAFLLSSAESLRGHIPLDPEKVVHTVGSGDCLLAGFIDALLWGRSTDAALRRGLAVAAANALSLTTATFNFNQVIEFEPAAQSQAWT